MSGSMCLEVLKCAEFGAYEGYIKAKRVKDAIEGLILSVFVSKVTLRHKDTTQWLIWISLQSDCMFNNSLL